MWTSAPNQDKKTLEHRIGTYGQKVGVVNKM